MEKREELKGLDKKQIEKIISDTMGKVQTKIDSKLDSIDKRANEVETLIQANNDKIGKKFTQW